MPLEIPPGKVAYVVRCDTCGTVQGDLDETELVHADGEARSLGWLPFPRSGVPAARWQWKCPACLPPRSSSSMPSTPALDFRPPDPNGKPPPDSDDFK